MAHTPDANAEDLPATSAANGAATSDAARAIRFLAIEAAVFIGIPIVAAVVAVALLLK